MRYNSVLMEPVDCDAVVMLSRKRPRHDELPPLHAYHSHNHGLSHASYEQPRPAMLPTLSQVLSPSVHLSVMAPPQVPRMHMPHAPHHYQYAHNQHHQHTPMAHQPRAVSPTPAVSETSMEDEDESEDKTPWPTANEYYDLLTNDARKANIPVYDLGVDPRGVPLQPEFIYNEPRSCMYFLKCSQLLGRGSFGFPRKKKTTVTTKNAKGGIESVRRCDASKEFEWRKMSFVTGLPKKQPLVRYITATCYSKTHRSSTEKKKVMRMHAVMLANDEGNGESGDYVLVHIRAGGSKRVGVRTQAPASEEEMAEQLRDLRAQVQKSIEKLTQALNTLDRSGKNGDKQVKQRRQLEFFNTQMRLLRNAIVDKLMSLGSVAEPRDGANGTGKSARLKTVIAASRRRSDDLYLLRAILQRAAKCEVRHVIAGARVPIIRFLHKRSGHEYECDLCFENVLATRNTPLLRAYAAFDDRARALGLAVKHWAKQRNISDASMGFLSSYSFVLLSIFYLQVVHVLPNLQSPRLLESARILPDYYNDINIAFCEDRKVAQAFHARTSGNDSVDKSLTALLVGFFEFYATQFDFAKRVVTVRAPETPVLKLSQWGSRKAKTWRISIQDPLETGRDLGCVLQFKGQERIISELRRAHEMLTRGESFSSNVCAAEKSVKPAKVKQRTTKYEAAKTPKQANEDAPSEERKTTQQQAEKMKRSYVMVLQSADEELTKEAIETLFKDYHKSFRVCRVEEASTPDPAVVDGSKNKRWEVEVQTQAQNCPRTLSQRTRIDWKAADGRVGRVWVHHQALFATPPCHKCLSPEHTTGTCPPEDVDGGDDEDVGDKGGPRPGPKILQKNIRRHVLRLTLGGDHSNASAKKADRRRKQQQNGDSTNHNAKRNSRAASNKREIRGDKTNDTAAVRRVEMVEVVKSSSSVRVEGDVNSNKSQKKKRQQHVHRKRSNSKAISNNAVAE